MKAEDSPSVSLLELAKSRRKQRGSRCTIARLLQTSPKSDEIADLIANSGDGRGEEISYATSAEIISEGTGVKVEGQTISRHLRGRCACS